MRTWGDSAGLLPGKALAAALAAALACLALGAAGAVAAPPPPTGVEVQGGEQAWHADRVFHVYWQAPQDIVAIHYRLRDPLGSVIEERRVYWVATNAEVEVPGAPGVYLAEIWLEDGHGAQGPPAEAELRFDDTRPPGVSPLVPGTWIGRNAFPLSLRLEHPGPEPPSGIRGYAIAVDPVPGREPCAAADRCTAAETDLAGGAEDDALEIAGLPEGTSYVSAVAVSGSGIRSAGTGRAALHVDQTLPLVRLSGAPTGWTNKAVKLTATATDDASGMLPDGYAPTPFTAIRVDGGRPVVEPGSEVSAAAIGEGVHSVAYYARDLAGNVADGGAGNGVPNPAPPRTEVRIDRTAPGVAFLNAQDPLDPELIRVRVADPLSGPDPSRGWIGVRPGGSDDPFLPLAPAPAPGGELAAHWDSDAFPPGEYEFEATAYDRAGNAATTTRKADGEEMALMNPLKIAASVRTGFGTVGKLGQNPRQRSTRYGRGAVLSGRLTEGQGTPLPHRPVRIVERFAAGAPAERVSIAWTATDGSFAARLLPGPSREAIAVFDGSTTLTHAVSQPLRLGVRSGVRLRASSTEARVGGAPLLFSGRVAASPGTIPAEGKSVELQFRVAGLPWSEFRTLQTDRHGRFRYAYRFTDDDSRGVRFQFRAFVPAQSGWPYEPAGSLPVIVRGR